MRYLFSILLALFVFSVDVQAAGLTGYNASDTKLGGFHKLKCGQGLTCTVTSSRILLSPNGTELRTQVASTTTTLTSSQCGSTIISNSADVVTLPEASTVLGCRFTFVCGTADDFDINPNDGTDTILSVSTTNGTTGVVTLAPSAGDAIRCTDIGGSITLEAIGANSWAQVGGGNGIWTDVN